MDPIQESTWVYAHASHIAWEYDDYYGRLPLFDYDSRVLDELLVEPGRVIDLGCGTGRHALQLARQGFEVTGLDLSPFMLDVAREKLERENLPAEWVRGTMTDLSNFPDGSFRYAICMFSTLGLIAGRDNRSDFLREVRRILRPGGLFVFHVHNRLHRLWDHDGRMWLIRTYFINPFQDLEVGDMISDDRGIPGMYLHVFSPREVRRLVDSSGMRIERLIGLNRERNGPLRRTHLMSLRANGLIAAVRR